MLIVWDYFGVMAQDTFWETASRLAIKNHNDANIWRMHDEVNLGQISWEEFCSGIAEIINQDYDEVVRRYEQHQINKAVLSAIRHLPEHTHVLLSNASEPYLTPIMQKLGLNSLFSEVFVSSAIGYAKPDERAFRKVLDAFKVTPDNSIMIDDSQINIESASRIGMKTVLYHKDVPLYEELKKLLA